MPATIAAQALQPLRDVFLRLTTIKPQEVKLSVGLDLGSTSIKVVALGQKKGGSARPVLGQHVVRLAPGQDTDPAEAIKSAVIQLHMPVRAVNLAVSGQWVIMRIVEMPAMKPTEIKQALPYEAQRYLPFSIQDVVVDGLLLGPADANKMWVLIVACKKELIERRVDWVRRAGLEIALVDVDALALANAYLASPNRKPEGTIALLNVGAQLSNLVILRGEVPYLVRDIPWGGDKLLRSVTDQVSGVQPEGVTKALTDNTVDQAMAGALEQGVETLATELELSFDYFENRFGQPPDTLLVSGGPGQAPAVQAALKQHMAQSVVPWTPAPGLSGQFAIAYGLALRTL